MGYKVGLTEAAQDDLADLVRFIAEKSPEGAAKVGNEVLDVALSLAVMPNRGGPVRKRLGIRKLSHRYYLIFYRVDDVEKWVEVVRIWDGRRDPARLNLP